MAQPTLCTRHSILRFLRTRPHCSSSVRLRAFSLALRMCCRLSVTFLALQLSLLSYKSFSEEKGGRNVWTHPKLGNLGNTHITEVTKQLCRSQMGSWEGSRRLSLLNMAAWQHLS